MKRSPWSWTCKQVLTARFWPLSGLGTLLLVRREPGEATADGIDPHWQIDSGEQPLFGRDVARGVDPGYCRAAKSPRRRKWCDVNRAGAGLLTRRGVRWPSVGDRLALAAVQELSGVDGVVP